MRTKYYIWAHTVCEYHRLVRENNLKPNVCAMVNDSHDRRNLDGLRAEPEQLIGCWPEKHRKIVTFYYDHKEPRKVIAVDFDGTIVESCFPNIGPIKSDVVNKVKEEKENGAVIILWTCRTGEVLEDAIQFLDNNNIPYDYVNENPLNPYGDTNRKIYADEYWDDKAIRIQ